MNEMADELKLDTTLAFSHTDMFVKAPFDKKMASSFTAFDADERLETIEEYLSKEIDFDYFSATGIIEHHFLLHKNETILEIQESFEKYRWKLIKGMISGNFLKYFEPINMIKNYYGEKYAFEYAFLIHYTAWLLIPGVAGSLVCIRMLHKFVQGHQLEDAIDTEMNGLFGLFLAIWATTFLESWRKKQEVIKFIWNCSDGSYSQQDERTDDFKFYNNYNPKTNQLEKVPKAPNYWEQKKLACVSNIFIVMVLICINIYQYVKSFFKDHTKADGT